MASFGSSSAGAAAAISDSAAFGPASPF